MQQVSGIVPRKLVVPQYAVSQYKSVSQYVVIKTQISNLFACCETGHKSSPKGSPFLLFLKFKQINFIFADGVSTCILSIYSAVSEKTSCRIKSFSVVTMVDTNLSILISIPILLSDSLRYVIYALNPQQYDISNTINMISDFFRRILRSGHSPEYKAFWLVR